MGNSKSLPDSETQYVSVQNFYRSLHEPENYGESSNIYQSRISNNNLTNSNKLLHKSISFTESTQEINRYLTILKNLGHKVECSNLYLPVLCKVKNSDKMCSEVQKLEIYYQHYDINIKNEITARKNFRERFTQPEIWYILYSTVNGIRMFEQFTMNSGNLKTDKILLNDKGHLKVVNILSWPENSNFIGQQNKSDLKKFYAPEQLRAMREKIDKRINYNIAETFSLGIIVLQLATFISGDSFYDLGKMELNDRLLMEADQILFNNYSRLLYNLVKTMLSGPYDRPMASQIYQVFRPHQSQILSLQPFHFIPSKNESMYVSNASLMSL